MGKKSIGKGRKRRRIFVCGAFKVFFYYYSKVYGAAFHGVVIALEL